MLGDVLADILGVVRLRTNGAKTGTIKRSAGFRNGLRFVPAKRPCWRKSVGNACEATGLGIELETFEGAPVIREGDFAL